MGGFFATTVEEIMELPFGITSKDVVTHAFVMALGGVIAWPFGQIFGFAKGVEEGTTVARTIATDISTEAAKRTRDILTADFVRIEVERAYKDQLSERERLGYENGRRASGFYCALEDYYKIMRGYLLQGAAVRSPDEAIRVAQNVVRIKAIGISAMGEVTGKALNGQIDELESALRKRDTPLVMQLLRQIAETVPARDIAFQRAKETFATAK